MTRTRRRLILLVLVPLVLLGWGVLRERHAEAAARELCGALSVGMSAQAARAHLAQDRNIDRLVATPQGVIAVIGGAFAYSRHTCVVEMDTHVRSLRQGYVD
jgi:hypothetical protein